MEGAERLNNFSLSAFSTLHTYQHLVIYPTLSWNVSLRILCKWGSEANMEIGQYGIKSVNLTLRPCSLQSICSDFSPINKQNIAVQMSSLIGSWVWWLKNMKNSHLTSLMPSPTDYRVETTECKNQLADVGVMLEMWVLSKQLCSCQQCWPNGWWRAKGCVWNVRDLEQLSISLLFLKQAWSCGKGCCFCKVRQ